MISPATLCEMFEFHYWARDRQLQDCASLTFGQFVRPRGNSFSSVRDTLAHLVGAEWLWLERWSGRSPRTMPAAEEFPTIERVAERWREVERDMRHYLAGLSDDVMERPLIYTNFKGETWTYLLWRTLFHLVNHQTYHRGQITTLLRQLGAQPTPIDFLVAHDVGFQPRG